MTKKKQKGIELAYRIRRIYTSKFSFEEITDTKLISNYSKKDQSLEAKLNITLNISEDSSTITVDINSDFKDKGKDKSLIMHTGRTIFDVKGLIKTKKEKEEVYDLPDDFVITLYSLAYSHSRALLSVELSPTVYKDSVFLPIINPNDFIKKD